MFFVFFKKIFVRGRWFFELLVGVIIGCDQFFWVKKGIFSTGKQYFLSIVKKKVDLLFEVGYSPALEKLCRTG